MYVGIRFTYLERGMMRDVSPETEYSYKIIRKVYIMSRFAFPIIFTAKPYSGFSACRVLFFEIQM